MATGYFNQNYWHANYWQANYWAPAGSSSGDYWNDNYWNVNYWNINYWLETNDGDVSQRNAAQLDLTAFVPNVSISLNAEPDTEALTLTTFQADANLDIDPAITSPSLALTTFDISVGLEGYQLGDIDLRWVPESTISVTFGVVASQESLPLGPMTHSIGFEGGINVAASVESLSLGTLVAGARLDVNPEPLPQSLTITSFDTTAGVGIQVSATRPSLSFALPTHTIVGLPNETAVSPLTVFLPIPTYPAGVVGVPTDVKPVDSFGDYGSLITNTNADTYPSFYEICERTGFRVKRGELVKEWNNVMVRSRSYESRHPQDFTRSVAERQSGSVRPEQTDSFIGQDAPEVRAEDL